MAFLFILVRRQISKTITKERLSKIIKEETLMTGEQEHVITSLGGKKWKACVVLMPHWGTHVLHTQPP
jgi:hypothetical protein